MFSERETALSVGTRLWLEARGHQLVRRISASVLPDGTLALVELWTSGPSEKPERGAATKDRKKRDVR